MVEIMKVRISSFYFEPKYYFEVSYRVDKYLESIVNEKIISKNEFTLESDVDFLHLIITTDKKTKIAQAKGPDLDKKNNCVTWAVWLPFKAVVKSDDYVLAYCDNFFDAVTNLFEYYDISSVDVSIAKKATQLEIQNNPIYNQIDEKSDEIDLSKL